jgi:hypothetical protein
VVLAAEYLLRRRLFHLLRIKIKIAKMAGVQDQKNHVTEMVIMNLWDHHKTVTEAGVLAPDLLLVRGTLVIPQHHVVVRNQIMTMIEIRRDVIVVMIVDEDEAEGTSIANVVLHAVFEAPHPHQESMAPERNGLVMTTQSAKEKSKVLKSQPSSAELF